MRVREEIVQSIFKQFPKAERRGIVSDRRRAIEFGKLPHIRIYEIEIEGPIYDEWPTPSRRALLGDEWETVVAAGKLTDAQLRKGLGAFASRAYRRPATDDEVERLVALVEARQASGADPIEAYADGLKAVLCSPNFLYLEQPNDQRTPAYALASRLSYFLWSSTPDQELLDLAASKKLLEPNILSTQVDRLLDDPKSDAFVDGFLGSWLALRDLGSMPPDREKFLDYYRFDLETAMRRETHLFARRLLDENLSVGNFLDADFAYVNRPLARLYGLKPPQGAEFALVSLEDRRRGGLLGQASVLTTTANGIDTSPVVRGVWLLENVLGTPPNPPPPDVEPLDPDSRGAKTIRDQLEKHRQVAACNDCHRKIDPIGFALENFDPIGRWRTSYGRNQKVDASGEMPNGKSFENVVGFKQVLLERREQFVHALTEKLLAYGTGRHARIADRPHVDGIVAACSSEGDGFRDLVRRVVLSDRFVR